MDVINNILYKEFLCYLQGLHIGLAHNPKKLAFLMELVNVIDYLNTNIVSKQDIRNIIRHYENS